MYLYYMWTLGNSDYFPKVMGHLVTEVTFQCFILERFLCWVFFFYQPFSRLMIKLTFGETHVLFWTLTVPQTKHRLTLLSRRGKKIPRLQMGM